MARRLAWISALSAALVLVPGAAFACGGLVAPGHAETLQRATTLSAWHAGYEHYVTGFQFAGTASNFGYIVPLPGVPTKIQKGGNWTLERLELAVNPPAPIFAALKAAPTAADGVQVLQQVKIEALNITVVRGGGKDVAAWAKTNGFDLTPDTGAVLGTYSSKGAVFALAKFDRTDAAKRGLIQGQGSVIQFTIPTKAPWIPLRILALGKNPHELVDADLFVLTDHAPSFNPQLWQLPGATVKYSAPADPGLLRDLHADLGMKWLPTQGQWLTAVSLHTPAGSIREDLSINGGGPPGVVHAAAVASDRAAAWWLAVVALVALVAVVVRRERGHLIPA